MKVICYTLDSSQRENSKKLEQEIYNFGVWRQSNRQRTRVGIIIIVSINYMNAAILGGGRKFGFAAAERIRCTNYEL